MPSKKPTKTQKKNIDYGKRSLAEHKRLHGKIAIFSKAGLKKREDWSTYYTPGVGAVSSHLGKHPEDARIYSIKRNTVAVISDGSAVLGLGNIGPYGALPVMEGKCVIFKEVADIDAFPIVLDTQDTNEIIETIKNIAPVFGGINLEDISAPRCFEIEARLKQDLTIPVMHDDQHGTAIVVLAGLINAAKVVKKKLKDLKVVIVGAGAAGYATALLLTKAGIANVIVTDREGIIYTTRNGLRGYKTELAYATNPQELEGGLRDALHGADALIGLSGPGTITEDHIKLMNPGAIVFALANPTPEIMPEAAKRAGAAIVGTGRSDFPNQINNALIFPGIFRGALDKGVTAITDEMKIRAALKIAALVKKPSAEEIIPSVIDSRVMKAVASSVR